MGRTRTLRALLLAWLLLPIPAFAEEYCGDRSTIVAVLEFRHLEQAMAAAPTVSGELIELWGNRVLDTWTLMITVPPKVGDKGPRTTCMLATGTTWTEYPEPMRQVGDTDERMQ